MSVTWTGPPPPPDSPLGSGDRLRVVLRGGAILAILLIAFPTLLLLRLPERAVFRAARPVTPWIVQGACKLACRVLGLRHTRRGAVFAGPGAFVANHVSWLDIVSLNACTRLTFVAKSEVAGWTGIGWLARGAGALFIARARSLARTQAAAMETRLRAGQRLLFFPEGTSTDGRRVLPFRSALFQAFLAPGLPADVKIQPVSVIYTAPADRDPAFYGWWGDMALVPSLLRILAAPRQGAVTVTFHPPIRVAGHPDRKSLARAAEIPIRSDMAAALARAP